MGARLSAIWAWAVAMSIAMALAAPYSAAQPEAASPKDAQAAPPEPVLEEVIENRTRHWSLVLPRGWFLAPQETVDAIDAEMSVLAPDKGFRCVAVLWMDETRGTSGPHIQVHAVPAETAGVSLDDIEKTLAGAREVAAARDRERQAATGKSAQPDETPPTLDREQLRIVSSGRLIVPPTDPSAPARTVRFTSTGMIGKKEVTKLIFYAPEPEFEPLEPTYRAVVDSFQYQAGWGYSPDAAPSPLKTGMPIGAGGLIAAGLIVVSVKLLWRRKKPKAARSSFGL